MEKVNKSASVVLAAALAIMVAGTLKPEPLQTMQSALVFLQKARMTAAVQAKYENLKKAKELLAQEAYDRGGYRAAAIAHTTQAMAMVNAYKPDKANQLIDMAIVKIRHGILAVRQENAAKNNKFFRKK